MLDQQHRQLGGDALDQRSDALALGGGEARQRLVEQQDTWSRRKRQPHVEQALSAIGECARFRRFDAGQPEKADQLGGFLHHRPHRARAGPAVEMKGIARLHREPQILEDGKRREKVGDLERSGEARRDYSVRRPAGDVDASEKDAAAIGNEQPGNQIEECRLAGAVGADQRVQGAVGDRQARILERADAAE